MQSRTPVDKQLRTLLTVINALNAGRRFSSKELEIVIPQLHDTVSLLSWIHINPGALRENAEGEKR